MSWFSSKCRSFCMHFEFDVGEIENIGWCWLGSRVFLQNVLNRIRRDVAQIKYRQIYALCFSIWRSFLYFPQFCRNLVLSLFDLILLCHHLFSAPTFFLPYSTVICVLLSISFHAFLFFLNVLRSEFLYKMIRKIFIWYFYVCPALAIVPFCPKWIQAKRKVYGHWTNIFPFSDC